jgi:2-dehydropantoate 2-reductase
MSRVAVVGVGAIGGVLAALLSETGKHEITLCTRRPLETLTVKTPDGVFQLRTKNLTDPAEAEPVDWVIIASKTYDAESTAKWLPGLAAEKAPVAVAQNGVEHRERFAPWVKQELLVPVVVQISADRQADGVMWQRSRARLTVEEGQLGRGFAELFQGSKSEIVVTEDFKTAMWCKLLGNSTGTLAVLAGRPFSAFRSEKLRPVVLDMARECIAVARAEGAQLDDSMAERIADGAMAGTGDRNNSMLADRLAGRPMEVEARNGVIVRLGEKHGIPTPLNRMAVAVLQYTDSI